MKSAFCYLLAMLLLAMAISQPVIGNTVNTTKMVENIGSSLPLPAPLIDLLSKIGISDISPESLLMPISGITQGLPNSGTAATNILATVASIVKALMAALAAYGCYPCGVGSYCTCLLA